jgi:hypothetical protein
MNGYGGVEVYSHVFLTPAFVGDEWSVSRSGRFTSGERTSGTYWIGGWMDPGTGLDDVENRKFLTLPGLKFWPLARPARSQSLYRLSYPGSQRCKLKLKYFNTFTMKRPKNVINEIITTTSYAPPSETDSHPDVQEIFRYMKSDISPPYCDT